MTFYRKSVLSHDVSIQIWIYFVYRNYVYDFPHFSFSSELFQELVGVLWGTNWQISRMVPLNVVKVCTKACVHKNESWIWCLPKQKIILHFYYNLCLFLSVPLSFCSFMLKKFYSRLLFFFSDVGVHSSSMWFLSSILLLIMFVFNLLVRYDMETRDLSALHHWVHPMRWSWWIACFF